MSSTEILARIGYDLEQLTTLHESRRAMIGMTVDLFQILCPGEYLLFGNDTMVRLFGYKIKVIPCSGLWWIVGLEGSAEEAKA